MELFRLIVECSGLDQSAISVDKVNVEESTLAPRVSPISQITLLHDSSLDNPVKAKLVQSFDRHVDVLWFAVAMLHWLFLFLAGCGRIALCDAESRDRKVEVGRELATFRVSGVILWGSDLSAYLAPIHFWRSFQNHYPVNIASKRDG